MTMTFMETTMLVLGAFLCLSADVAAQPDITTLTQLLETDKLSDEELPADMMRLEQLDLSLVEQEWGTAQAGKSVDGNPLTVGGVEFRHGVGTHANSEFIINLNGSALSFAAAVGVDDEVGELGSIGFSVWVDDKHVVSTETMKGGDKAKLIIVDLRGAEKMTLMVNDGDDDINYDHADWLGAVFELDPSVKARPVAAPKPREAVPVLAKGYLPEPRIHAPFVTGATPGHAFLFRIPTTGRRPIHFQAKGMPAGLTLNGETGIITGSLKEAGEWEVLVRAENELGSDEAVLTITGGEDKLALTPPMGWNSWNVWGTAVDDAKVRAAADWLVKSGLADVGYQYINIDDAWEGERDASGRLHSNAKFPDMKALADYVHSKGLKLGIYSSPGPLTCAGYPGSYEHELLDAQTWAEWGIDLVKYDWCSYGKIARDNSEKELRKPYEIMRDALDMVDHDIVFSMCQYGMGQVWTWGDDVGGNYWRTTGDIIDTWPSMSRIGFSQAPLAPFAGPGHWNDPDMLVLGYVGWGEHQHPSRLTPNEQVTHMTLWSMLSAPLLIGCDMTRLDEFTAALLGNPEVLAVNQDQLGKQAQRYRDADRVQIWARPLYDGSCAVAAFNLDRRPREVNISFAELGLAGTQAVRNLWLRSDDGVFHDFYKVTVPRHGAVMYRFTPVKQDQD